MKVLFFVSLCSTNVYSVRFFHMKRYVLFWLLVIHTQKKQYQSELKNHHSSEVMENRGGCSFLVT